MKTLIFRPTDFTPAMCSSEYIPDHVARVAQAKHDAWLKELIEGAIVIYHDKELDDVWTTMRHGQDTHTALMIDVKEIEKKCEKHEPMLKTFGFSCWQHGVCKHCGCELVANWTAK